VSSDNFWQELSASRRSDFAERSWAAPKLLHRALWRLIFFAIRHSRESRHKCEHSDKYLNKFNEIISPNTPCAVALRLMSRSPRGAMHYCPRRLADTDAYARLGTHITATLGAQTPGARTTRFCRTPIAPVVCATPSLTVARPAKPFAPMLSASTAVRPAFVTIAIRPSSLGRSKKFLTKIRIRIKRIILSPVR
jgi:hypothetical protein